MSYQNYDASEIEVMLAAIKNFIDQLNVTISLNAAEELKQTKERYREAIQLVGELDGSLSK